MLSALLADTGSQMSEAKTFRTSDVKLQGKRTQQEQILGLLLIPNHMRIHVVSKRAMAHSEYQVQFVEGARESHKTISILTARSRPPATP